MQEVIKRYERTLQKVKYNVKMTTISNKDYLTENNFRILQKLKTPYKTKTY